MATSSNKVQFGLSNAHYAVYDESTGKYGTPVAIKGSVSLSLDAEGDSTKFYADNIAYFSTSKNDGYTGSLEIAYVEKQLQIDLLGNEDDNGLLLEFSDSTAKSFALLFEIDGNINKQRTVLYNCTLSRPSTEADTTENTVEPKTSSSTLRPSAATSRSRVPPATWSRALSTIAMSTRTSTTRSMMQSFCRPRPQSRVN